MGNGAILLIVGDYNWISNGITLSCGLKINRHDEPKMTWYLDSSSFFVLSTCLVICCLKSHKGTKGGLITLAASPLGVVSIDFPFSGTL